MEKEGVCMHAGYQFHSYFCLVFITVTASTSFNKYYDQHEIFLNLKTGVLSPLIKVVAVTYERWSFITDSNYSDFTTKRSVFWKRVWKGFHVIRKFTRI